jgi:hypothetical protein
VCVVCVCVCQVGVQSQTRHPPAQSCPECPMRFLLRRCRCREPCEADCRETAMQRSSCGPWLIGCCVDDTRVINRCDDLSLTTVCVCSSRTRVGWWFARACVCVCVWCRAPCGAETRKALMAVCVAGVRVCQVFGERWTTPSNHRTGFRIIVQNAIDFLTVQPRNFKAREVAPRLLVHTSPSLTQHPVCFVLPCEVYPVRDKRGGAQAQLFVGSVQRATHTSQSVQPTKHTHTRGLVFSGVRLESTTRTTTSLIGIGAEL